MKKIVLMLALVARLIALLPFGGAAETDIVRNYSFTFNMSVPHHFQPPDPNHNPELASVRTLDGTKTLVYFQDMSDYPDDSPMSDSFIYLDSIKKDISGEGVKWGKIYVINYNLGGVPDRRISMWFDTLEMESTMNITQSIDFFRDVRIARINR